MTKLLPTGPDRWWRILLVTAALTALVLPMIWKHMFVDLKVYRLGGQALLDGIPLYHAKLGDTIMQFTYPPFAAVLMVPFAAMPFGVSVGVWTLGTVVALVAVWRLSLTDRLRGRRPHQAALLALVVGSTLMEPVRETLGYGQINVILCAVVLYDLVRTEDRPMRGIWLGIAAGLKLTPLVFFGVLLVNRQWRALAHACLGFAGTVVLGFLFTPSAAKEYWTETVRDTQRIGGLTYTGNQSINGLLARLDQNSAGGGTLWMALVVVVIGVGLLATRLLWQRGQRVAAVSSCALIGLFCSPVSWSHHWVWAIPLGAGLVSATRIGRAHPLRVGAVWFGFWVITPIWWPLSDKELDNAEFEWNLLERIVGNSYLIAGAVALGMFLWSCRRTTRAPAQRRTTEPERELVS